MAVTVVNDDVFTNEIQTHSLVVVKYYADWCGACKLFAPKFRRLSEDARFSSVRFLDVNAEENENARKMAGVDNLPFFAIIKNGELVEGQSTSKEENVVAMLEKLIS